MADSTSEHMFIPPNLRPTLFNVNEAMGPPEDVTPGIMVREFALAERARELGLMNVSRTIWEDPCITDGGGDPGFGNAYTYTVTTHLLGLVYPCCETSGDLTPPPNEAPYDSCNWNQLWFKRYAWWTQKWYADLEGTFVQVNPTNALDGLAAITGDEDSLRIIVGKFGLTNQEDVRIVLKRMGPLVVNSAVQVSIKRLDIDLADPYYVPSTDTLAPVLLRVGREIVIGDSCIVEIPAADFEPGDALSIEVTPIVPDTTVAEEDFLTLQGAIDSTDVGNIVVIKPRSTGNAHETHLILKNGVKVVGKTGTLPSIIDDAETMVLYPTDANAFTALEGIEIRAGSSTKNLVVIKGNGSIRKCVLKDMGQGSVIRGILADEHAGEIRDCTVQMTSHSHVSGQVTTGVVGIDLGGDYEVNNSHVVNCSINVKTGFSPTWGIRTSTNASAVIESTFVKGERHGIQLWNDCIARFCTVDSTYWEGIAGDATARIENCIVSNILFPSVTPGILGSDIDYCICPAGFPFGSSTTNKTENPLYCGPGVYTLRADSYGNPDNNTSGKQIGAFPVGCLFGALVRNVSWDATHPALHVLGDVTVPSGKSLTLGNGAVLKCGPGDNQGGGADGAKTEIIVNGTFAVSASSQAAKLTSALPSPSAGDWLGLRFVTGAVVSVDSAVVEYSQGGMLFDQATSGTVSRTRFRYNENQDFRCVNMGASEGVTLEESNLQVLGGTAGIWLDYGSSLVTIRKNTIVRAGSDGYGIQLLSEVSDPGTPLITENTISGFLAGAGIYITWGSPTITKNTISNCAAGIKTLAVGPGTPLIGANGVSTSDNVISGNTTGIACDRPTQQAETMDPIIRENKIQNNTYGITAKNGAAPDAGKSGNNHGNNTLTGNSGYCIWNRNTGQHPPEISAKYNYFGQCVGGDSLICWLGNVDASNALCSPPAGAGLSPELTIAALPEKRSLIQKVLPNPTRTGVTVSIWIEAAGTTGSVGAFDIAGRRVRNVWSGIFPGGSADVSWNGLDDQGQRVPAGIYFIRVKASTGSSEVARVLFLR